MPAVKDIDDGNMVTLQVFFEGQDPAVHVALAQIPTTVDGGKATGTWKYVTRGNEIPPDSDPAFFFSAHSAWCAMKKSGNATVALKRPELSSLEWKDEDGSSTGKGLVGKKLTLSASCNGDTDDGAGVIFRVFPDGADVENDMPVAELATTNSGGKAEAEWTVPIEDKIYYEDSCQRYYYLVSTNKCVIQKSQSLDIGFEQPEFANLKWEIKNEERRSEVDEIFLNKKVLLSGEIDKMPENSKIELVITSNELAEDECIFTKTITIINRKIEYEWVVVDIENKKESKEEKKNTEYYFYLKKGSKIKSKKSNSVPVYDSFSYEFGSSVFDNREVKLLLQDGSEILTQVKECKIEVEKVPIGAVSLILQ